MRRRFFITIFSVLCLTAGSTSAIHHHFFKLERLRLIELNLEQNASLLGHSKLTFTENEFTDLGDEMIENIIGDDKVNMIVAIYGENGKVLYKNDNAKIFDIPENLPTTVEKWEDVEAGDYFIKYLTVKDQGQNRTIRVGMILNQSLLRWKDLNQRASIFVSIILAIITFISFLLTNLLFRPVKHLADDITTLGEKLEKGEYDELKSWFGILGKKPRDEFQSLLSSLNKLTRKVIETQKQTQKWSALMAHELKTPMTILKNSIENLIEGSNVDKKKIMIVEHELERLEVIIMDFLEWASLENDTSRPDLHSLQLGKRCEQVVLSLHDTYPGHEIKFENRLSKERRIFCNPLHFDQLISNLLVNGLKYGKKVEFVIEDQFVDIKDDGDGIPQSVLDNFGRPFNKFQQGKQSGHGLGLAWVNTIAKKYEWELIFNNHAGTSVKIIIPESTET